MYSSTDLHSFHIHFHTGKWDHSVNTLLGLLYVKSDAHRIAELLDVKLQPCRPYLYQPILCRAMPQH